MKHIKKKFSFERPVTDKDLSALQKVTVSIDKKEISGKTKIPKNHQAIIITEEKNGITAFQYSNSGTNYIIPEPDPILIYFHNAQISLRQIAESKKQLFAVYREDKVFTEKIKHQLYTYYGLSSGFVIFLFTAIEAFLNRMIPNEYEYKIKSNRKTEIYDKEQIQRHIAFDTKLKEIIPEICHKSFSKTFPLKQQHLENLREFRDSIVHTKANKGGHTAYDYIYKRSFNFDYESTIWAVRDIINFYKPDFIEDCNCGQDF